MMDRRQRKVSINSVVASDDEVQLLVELVGAYELSADQIGANVDDSDLNPYCIVKFAGKRIHHSLVAREKGNNPIWTISTGSLFLLHVTPRTLLDEKLKISVWSTRPAKDRLFLGQISIDGKDLISHCNEERLELHLKDLDGNDTVCESTLALRFRLASPADVDMVTKVLRRLKVEPEELPTIQISVPSSEEEEIPEDLASNPVKDLILKEGGELPVAKMVTESHESQLVGEMFINAVSFAFRTKTKHDEATGLRKLLVKPGPDPKRLEETKYLSPVEITEETKRPSHNWIEAGTGNIGTLHLEILSCHGLPNVDVGEAVGNLSDCFVCAVFEDALAQTPVIDDELSPHWMPWTQRAFRFGIMHPASTLYLGVLDYDIGPGSHEPIGRVAVNLSNFEHDMLYTLRYNLYPSSNVTERTSFGAITIRLRIEYKDEKKALLAALKPRPQFHVNTRRKKTFLAVRYTCFGEHDKEEQFDLTVTKSYVQEILEYWRDIKYYRGRAFQSLIFWRSQVHVCGLHLPVHSALFFFSCATLVERPSLFISFFLLLIAWIMLATQHQRLQDPSPWKKCKSFWHFLDILRTGKAPQSKRRIVPSEAWEQAQAYEREMVQRKEQWQLENDSLAAKQQELFDLGDENIHTEVKAGQMIPIELMERLGRYQGIIGRILLTLRKWKGIVVWEESLVSFWITCCCLFGGLVSLVLPWTFILTWTGRLVVWLCLGPHMKIVDAYMQLSSKDEQKNIEEFCKHKRAARVKREEAVKLKDVKCLAFGKYITAVPPLNLARHYDRPLHASYGRFLKPSPENDAVPINGRIPGQQLFGPMIPLPDPASASRQEVLEKSKKQLEILGGQVERLQTITDSLSSRNINYGLDDDLPGDLGYELALCNNEEVEEDTSVSSIAPNVIKGNGLTHTLSQIGLEVDKLDVSDTDSHNDDNETQRMSTSSRDRLMEQPCKSPLRTQATKAREGESSLFQFIDAPCSSFFYMTPTQKHIMNGDDQGTEIFYMTPTLTTDEQNVSKVDASSLSLAHLELRLKSTRSEEDAHAGECKHASNEEHSDDESVFGSKSCDDEIADLSPVGRLHFDDDKSGRIASIDSCQSGISIRRSVSVSHPSPLAKREIRHTTMG